MTDVGAGRPRLAAPRLRKSFGDFQAVADVSLSLAPGEIHGLCGPNGAGKSTVVKMLSGQLEPDGGRIEIDGDEVLLSSPHAAQQTGIAIVDQELSVVPALTVGENLALGAGRRPRGRAAVRAWRDAVRRDLAAVGLPDLDLTTPVARLTLGERQLVEIARALGREASIMILDEPTATLSDVEIERVFTAVRRVAADGRAVIFVSHRLGEVLSLCDRVTVVRDGRVVATTATADLTVPQLVEQMIGSAVASTRPPRRDRAQDREPVARVSGLRVTGALAPFDLDVQPGRIYALAGQVGSGAETVVRALAGLVPTARGELVVSGRRVRLGDPAVAVTAGVAYVSGDRKVEGLFLRSTVAANLMATRLSDIGKRGLLGPHRLRARAVPIAEKAGVAERHLDAPVASLSGGNQQKVSVGRALERPDVAVLVLDEPTRGVDVAGRAMIHDLLRSAAEGGLAVVYSSTDLDELVDLPDEVVTFWGGRVVDRHHTPIPSSTVLGEITHRKETVA